MRRKSDSMRIPRSGVYRVRAAEGRSLAVPPSDDSLPRPAPSPEDKALVKALRARRSR